MPSSWSAMGKFDVIIIGGGLGGLLCGQVLSKEGFNVCVIEKNRKPGGSLQTFGRKGCVFNTGLNYTESLDNGQVLNQYFRYFGLMDNVAFRRLDADGFERISFNDRQYRFAMGQPDFVETLAAAFPGERAGLEEYAGKMSDVCMAIPLYSLREEQLSLIGNPDLSTGAADYISSVIGSPRLRNILAGNNLLYAGNEQKTPLFIHALINHSFIESAWRVVDGSHQIVNRLIDNIKSAGGTVMLGSKAVKLTGDRNSIDGVELQNGDYIEGKQFIAAVHPDQILDMVDPGMIRKAYSSRIRGLDSTMGMFTVYLVFKKDSFPYLNYNFYHYNQNNVWIASDYRKEEWPQNYLFMNTATSGSQTFAESGSIITYMDYAELAKWEHTFTGERGDDYIAFKQHKAEKLLDAVEMQFPGIRSSIAAVYTSTPLTWRDYTGTREGSAYGILKDHNRPLESMVMPRTKIQNLFLTGQNTNVHGILGVTISSIVTCAELVDIRKLVRKIRKA
jgi:all-trans-retinol 13,14-reductase